MEDSIPGREPTKIGRLRALAWGRVQGVFFRDHVSRVATGLGLRGYVRNLADGSVEVVAEGSRPALEELLEQVRQGPPSARVDGVEAFFAAPVDEFNTWEVRW